MAVLLLSVLSKVLSASASDSTTSNEFSKTIPESFSEQTSAAQIQAVLI